MEAFQKSLTVYTKTLSEAQSAEGGVLRFTYIHKGVRTYLSILGFL